MSLFKEDYCCVCLEEFEQDFTPLNECGHYIHLECIINSGKNECPLCRKTIKVYSIKII